MPEIILGMNDLQERLRELEASVQRETLIEAAKAGAAIVVEEAQRLAPRDTGAGAEGIALKTQLRSSDINEGNVDVSYNKKQFYMGFQESGTVHHAAQPFLKPALDNNRERIDAAVQAVLIAAIEKVAT